MIRTKKMRTSKTGSLFFIKKILYLTLCIIIEFFAVFSCFNVEAAQLPLNTSLKQDLRNVLIQRGIITENGLSDEFFDFLFPDREFYGIGEYSQAISDAALEKLGITINAAIAVTEKGEYVYSESLVDVLRQLFDEYLSENPEQIDVVWLPVITEKNLQASWFYGVEDYGRTSALFNTHDLVMFMCYPGESSFLRTSLYLDMSDFVLYGSFGDQFINGINYLIPNFGTDTSTGLSTVPGFADENGVNVSTGSLSWNSYVNGAWSTFNSSRPMALMVNPFFTGSLNTMYYQYLFLCASSESGIHYVPYFKSLNAYRDYVTGNGNYYRFDSGYTGGDITINPDADYSEITDAIRDAMQEAIQSGKSVTAALANMQKAFTVALGKINSTLGDISDNTQQTNKWLEMIYELLQNQQEELQAYLESSGQSLDDLIGLLSHTDSSGSRTSIYDLLGSFLLLFRVQQEDFQAFMSDAQDFFKMQPVKVGIMIEAAKQDIVEAIEKVVEAVNGISINIDYGDVDGGGSDGESLWTQLGKGLAKILTAVLDLLKVLIFKGLDALGYLAGVMIANIGQVFDGIGVYFDRYIGYIEENTFFAAIKDILPEELQTILVLSFFSIAVAGIIKYAKKG